jgi:hypothetical protein
MESLFIGQTHIDVTVIADHMPEGDEKAVASEYAVSFGGNAGRGFLLREAWGSNRI